MAELTITAIQVANRLNRSVNSFNSDYLESAGLITFSQAYFTKLLANNSQTFDDLDTTEQAVLTGITIAHCAKLLLMEKPENWRIGPVQEGENKNFKSLIDSLKEQIKEGIELLGLRLQETAFSTIGNKLSVYEDDDIEDNLMVSY